MDWGIHVSFNVRVVQVVDVVCVPRTSKATPRAEPGPGVGVLPFFAAIPSLALLMPRFVVLF